MEDNPADAGLVREALEEYAVACELILVGNGEQAIQLIESFDAEQTPCPALVILDLNLPRKSGSEVLQRLRESPACAAVPVIVLTSSDSKVDRERALLAGASLYVRKPLRLDEFLKLGAVFQEMLDSGRRSHGPL
ncbi:MAG: response regulator [Acidobacteriaceae bacterium]|nr:response regulator [Acidobacteriaceae bacterium]MBV8569774.1 response regulator [Acidobacteriaceae bacterium]